MSQASEQSKAHTWSGLPSSGHFFSCLIEEIFFALCFKGWVGLFACFLRSREFSPLFQFAGAGVGAVSKWHAQEYKRALHLWSCFVVFPSILVCYNLKEAIELKGGTNILQVHKARESSERPNFHETLLFQFIFKWAPKQLDNLSVAGHSW